MSRSRGPTPIIPSDVKHQILDKVEEGVPQAAIAKEFGLSRSTVQYVCLQFGIMSPKPRKGIRRAEMTTRNGFIVRFYSQREDNLLIRLRKEGRSLKEIGEILGRNKSSIRNRLLTIARREEYENL